MKKLLIFVFSVMCFLALNLVALHNAYSASQIEDMFSGNWNPIPKIERERLKDIDKVYIVIEKIADDARSLDINEENIKTGVEIKIRNSGIKVDEKNSFVMFYIDIGVTPPISRLYGVAVRVEVKDMVSLLRNPQIKFQTTIWDKSKLVIAGEYKVKEVIKESVDELVDKFILDYLKAKEENTPMSKDDEIKKKLKKLF